MPKEITTTQADLHDLRTLPYRIAVLCYLYDDEGRILLLHRAKNPNAGMYSPIGGKLEISNGEGPHDCARREIYEEAGLEIEDNQVRLTGVVSETSYENSTHWLIFLFEVTRSIRHEEITMMDMNEGKLEWVEPERVDTLQIPETDRLVMWPLVRSHRGGFFMVHIDCTKQPMTWMVHESVHGEHHV